MMMMMMMINKWSSTASTSSDKGDWSAEHKPERLPRRMTASSRWRSSAAVKPHLELAAWLRTDRSGGCWLWVALVLQARNDDDDDCIGSTWKTVTRVVQNSWKLIVVETLNTNHWIFRREKISWNFTLLLTCQKFSKALISRNCLSSIS